MLAYSGIAQAGYILVGVSAYAAALQQNSPSANEALAATTLAGQDPPTLVVRSVSPGGLDALLATGLVRQRGWRLAFEYGEVQRAAATVIQQSGILADLHRRLADAWAGLGRRTGADVDLPLGLHRLHADQADQAVAPPAPRCPRVAPRSRWTPRAWPRTPPTGRARSRTK